MPPERVILDSDDELEEDAAHQQPASPPQDSLSTNALTVDLSASTGSTDLLNRDIQDAHRALMEPTPDSKVSNPSTNLSTKRPSVSPAMSRNKRRRTMATTPSEAFETNTGAERRKSFKTYGSNDRRERGSSISEGRGSTTRISSLNERRASGNEGEDEWEVPGSSPSRDPLAARREAWSTRVKSRTAVKDTITVDSNPSKASRRSTTLGGVPKGPVSEPPATADPIPSSTTRNETNLEIASSSGDEEDVLDQPRRKRLKRSNTMHGYPNEHKQAVTTADQNEALFDATHSHPEATAGHSIAVDLSDPALALTTSQKNQYTVASKTPSQPGVIPTSVDVLEFADRFARYPGESSTIPNTTPVQAPTKDTEISSTTKTSTGSSELLQHLLPSSPPINPASLAASDPASQRSKALRRSKSSLPEHQPSPNALLESTASTTNSASPTVKARLARRSRTVADHPPQETHSGDLGRGAVLSVTETASVALQENPASSKDDKPEEQAPPETNSPKQETTEKDTQADELGSDDLAVGLPKEQYKPRPSRSRSTRNADSIVETVDFSKRPEVQAKAKIKRSKTLGAAVKPDNLIELPSFPSAKPEKDHAVNNKSKAKRKRTVDSESTSEAPKKAEEAVVDKDTPGVQNVHKALEPDISAVELLAEHEHPNPLISGPDSTIQQAVVKQAISAAEPLANHPLPNTSLQEAQNDSESTSMPKPRGRPRKSSSAPKPRKRRKTDEPPIEPSEEPIVTEAANQQTTDGNTDSITALAEQDGNTGPPNPVPSTTTTRITEGKPAENGKEPTPSPKQIIDELQTPKRPAKKGPDKHSPLNSGKVPYRVGLSKRARIEPLLRIVRK